MTIAIVGCGWLGIPLAERLIAGGFAVKGSTTSEKKLALLQSKGIDPYLISLETDEVQGDIGAFLSGCDILVIDIPPRFHFARKIAALVPKIEQSGIKKVLHISSVSVYDHEDLTLTETVVPNPKTEKAQQLFQAENLLRNPNFSTTIVRFGGLIGGSRHPVHYLAAQTDLENPDAPVNLIHLQDCIGIIGKIIEKNIWGETFNAASPEHPTREDYYIRKAKEFKLVPPQFSHQKPSEGKIIDPSKLIRQLDYQFQLPEL